MNLKSRLQAFVDQKFKKHPTYKKTKRIWRRHWFKITLAATIIFAIFAYLTNPFVRFSVITDPFNIISFSDSTISIQKDQNLIVKDGFFFRQLGFWKGGWHIMTNKLSRTKKPSPTIVDEVIASIHQERFNPDQIYLISGDHFTVFYPRSLGIFYHSLLDPRTALDQTDWNNRQLIYLKSLSYALQAYKQSDRLSTTIAPIAPRSVALVNVYTTPSDTLYSLLYALQVLSSTDTITTTYPYQQGQLSLNPSTQNIAQQLLEEHKSSLVRHLQNYQNHLIDPQTGLIKKDIYLSSTKDIVKRQSSFYDNVILWRTQQLAQELGLQQYPDNYFPALKQKILDTYWLPDKGYFLDHLSPESLANSYYSSDWLIVLMTGFLNPFNPQEQIYFQKPIEYIQRNALDYPFGLQYHADPRRHELHLIPRLSAEYASTTLWSNWGQEYIKLLTLLAQATGDKNYLDEAQNQLDRYAYNIKRYQGYPEVYNQNGDIYRDGLYKSIHRTGWIVSFEQSRALFDYTKTNWNNFSQTKPLETIPQK